MDTIVQMAYGRTVTGMLDFICDVLSKVFKITVVISIAVSAVGSIAAAIYGLGLWLNDGSFRWWSVVAFVLFIICCAVADTIDDYWV